MYQRSVSIAGFAIGDDKLLRNLNDINNWLTLGSKVLLQKPTFARLVKNFPASYGTGNFVTVSSRNCGRSLSWARWIQSTSPPISTYGYVFFVVHFLQVSYQILYALFSLPWVLHVSPVASSLVCSS
jgi:hypothetical protein